MGTTLSKRGAAFIAHFEGVYTHLYNDPAGHCTIGVGHLVHHGPCNGGEPDPFRRGLSRAQALKLLLDDAAEFAEVIDDRVKVSLTQPQRDALISFAFNVGAGAFGSSTLLRKLNAGSYAAVPDELARWTKAGTVTLPGLVRRRRAEGDLFAHGRYDVGDASDNPPDEPGSLRDVQRSLTSIGWAVEADGVAGPLTRQAVADFQRGFGLAKLAVDGVAGPKTMKAVRRSAGARGCCSEHFRYAEFASKGNRWIKIDRALVVALEKYRQHIAAPVDVISGYRDPAHNSSVGGKSSSQHLFGCAADIAPVISLNEMRSLKLFSGIGYNATTGKVVHVDVRHAGPKNLTGGTPATPTVWEYAR